MPIYEYLCEKCGHEFEREQRITEDPVKTCPECRAKKVRRLISRTAFVLKGGGWYSDLYSSSQPDAEKKGEKSEAPASSSESKTETKSETAKSSDSGSGGSKGKGKKSKPKAA